LHFGNFYSNGGVQLATTGELYAGIFPRNRSRHFASAVGDSPIGNAVFVIPPSPFPLPPSPPGELCLEDSLEDALDEDSLKDSVEDSLGESLGESLRESLDEDSLEDSLGESLERRW